MQTNMNNNKMKKSNFNCKINKGKIVHNNLIYCPFAGIIHTIDYF